ncbi:MAG: TadE/TadG family type IV pilus assembly protein [Bacteriovoracia bacterium]
MERCFRIARLVRNKKNNKGQISVLIVLSLIPMFTLFAFVVNLGMMVHAKISLQNAADLAAYAGAATQARQLTHIAHLNYMMRQAYKKFLFKYYVIGSRSLRCFPRSDESDCINNGGTPKGDNQDFDWLNPGGSFPNVPVVCISLNPESNSCQLAAAVPLVQTPNCFPLDPICGTLAQSTEQIRKIQQTSCGANSALNEELLALWLYATDRDNPLNSQVNLKGLIQDIGLVTEEVLLLERIETVRSQYINSAPQTVTQSSINSLRSVPDQAKTERSILAFETAIGNLNESVFNPSGVVMQELQPKDMLTLETIRTGDKGNPGFQAAYAKLDGTSKDECKLSVLSIGANPPVGVKVTNPGLNVFYAVRLTAKAKLLFNPFPFGGNPDDGVEMTAYAAAAPFGSRIGPQDLDGSEFVAPGKADGITFYPNIRVGRSPADTMQRAGVLKGYLQVLRGDANNATTTTDADYQRGLRAAQVPDEAEIGRYSIPVDIDYSLYGGETYINSTVPYFGPPPVNPQDDNRYYTFWAPLLQGGPGSESQLRDKIKAELEFAFGPFATQQGSKSETLNYLQGRMDNYFNSIKSTNNFNIARMQNPLAEANSGFLPPFKVVDPTKIATSYSTDHDYAYYAGGRDGYSVKYIPFKKVAAKISSGPAGQIVRSDIGLLEH